VACNADCLLARAFTACNPRPPRWSRLYRLLQRCSKSGAISKALSFKTGRQSTLSQIDRIFAKDVLPRLGLFDIFEVDNSHLLEVLRRIERRKAFSMAEKVRTWLNQMFRYAMVEKGLRHNPASDLDIVATP